MSPSARMMRSVQVMELATRGFMLGGGGGAVLGGHLWLGGKGFGILTAPFVNARGEAMLTGGGGGAELGYVLSRSRMLVIPFFSFGAFGYGLEVTNKSGQAMPLEGSAFPFAGRIAPFQGRLLDGGARRQSSAPAFFGQWRLHGRLRSRYLALAFGGSMEVGSLRVRRSPRSTHRRRVRARHVRWGRRRFSMSVTRSRAESQSLRHTPRKACSRRLRARSCGRRAPRARA